MQCEVVKLHVFCSPNDDIYLNFFHQAFAKQFHLTPDDLDMHVIYDVSHNIAKIEEHIVDGKQKTLFSKEYYVGNRSNIYMCTC